MNSIITVHSLRKTYKEKTILDNLSFSIKKGEIFALIGTNGAGKTTLLECIEGLKKYSGTIEVNDTIGVQLQSASLPPNIKTKEALTLFEKWHNFSFPLTLLQQFNLQPFINKKYKELSTGQKRRLHLVLALTGNPAILFLDEPTAGLDVEGRLALHELIKDLKNQGKTIVLTSHDMAEVEELCDRIAILKNGQLEFIGTIFELTKNQKDIHCIYIKLTAPLTQPSLKESTYLGEDKEYYLFETVNLEKSIHELTSILLTENKSILDIKIKQTSLEQRFMDLAKEEL